MRMDLARGGVPLTVEQSYFLGCWFNMVHQYSLDSFRVRVMNPVACVREVQEALGFAEAKPEEREMVLREAISQLGGDRVLKRSRFGDVVSRLLSQMDVIASPGKAKAEGGAAFRLLQYFLNEAAFLIDAHYLDEAFEELRDLLLTPAGGGNTQAIHSVTGSLLSVVLERDFSIESLYQLYAQFLSPRKMPVQYDFSTQLAEVEKHLKHERVAYDVTFAVDAVTNPDELTANLGGLAITDAPIFKIDSKKSAQFAKKQKRRFVSVYRIEAADLRSAGRQAYDKVTNVINLLRFEYEQSRLQVSDHFAVQRSEGATRWGQVYPIPKVVPNPIPLLDGNDAAGFVDRVNELAKGPNLSAEGRDRLISAFRLYRQGRDQEIVETKLVHWWTAMEYLVRGNQAGGGIGKSVENAIAPVIALSYVPKMLVAIRNVLVEIKSKAITHPSGKELRLLSVRELWDLFRMGGVPATVSAELSSDPFVKEQVEIFLDEISDPNKLQKRLENHTERVRWQLQRIWRTRCDIVHSAGRGANHLLLCSNLEYYLKTTLHGLLNSLRTLPTLSGPLEYFDRRSGIYGEVIKGLGSKKFDQVMSSFDG